MRHDGKNPARPRPKRHLAVRMLVARLDWLSGLPHWEGGRIVWRTGDGVVTPEASDLARAQRCLYKIRQYPLAAPQVLGDSRAWLDENQDRLERIKRLAAIREPDIPALIGQARSDTKQPPVRLLALLAAEAVCVNPLPDCPSRALTTLGPRAGIGLTALTQDPAALPEERRLAALTLGALHRQIDAGPPPSAASFPPSDGAARAYQWGRRYGLTPTPALVCALLADDAGEELARRCLEAVSAGRPLRLQAEGLHRLLAGGTPPQTVTALAEAVAAAQPVAERVMRYRDELPDLRSSERLETAQALGEQRRETFAVLSNLYERYALATADPATVALLTPCLFSLLELGPPSTAWADAVSDMLGAGLTLPPSQLADYLTLLTESHTLAADRPALSTPPKDLAEWRIWRVEARQKWLPERRRTAHSLRALLLATGDAAIVRDALTRGVLRSLSDYRWADRDTYRWLLMLAASVPRPSHSWQAYRFCELVDGLGDIKAIRATLHPILTALEPETPETRALVWEALLDEIGWERTARRAALPRLGRYVTSLADFAGQTRRPGSLEACVGALIRADQAIPDRAQAWLDGLLADLSASEQFGDEAAQALRSAALLASALGDDGPDRFETIFEAARRHTFHVTEHKLEQGLALLGRFPALKMPLAEIFPAQSRRCVDLLVRLGLTARLGTDALAPLGLLEPQRGQSEASASFFPLTLCPDDGWWRLHRLCPEQHIAAACYRHARWVLGADAALPPGLRRVMTQPERLAGELGHLDRLAGTDAPRPDLDKRRAKLQALLADPAERTAEVREAVRERLPRLAAEAQTAALERQIQTCYWARLEELAGPLPHAGPLTEDVINAILLAADISQNRRLLLRLLRAHLAGETRWREEHPDNAQYLASLAARGVDLALWLSARPRRYPCADAAGGRVHLWLERDPLHVLQMGNYFDTCLSFDSFNAFSTVANACEMNKRVVYARDGAGHVIGRKLIGIADTHTLVGFRTYTSLEGSEANARLRAIFRHYLTGFASDCGLPLADSGNVPTLFAEAWYDDGTVAWEGPETVSSVVKTDEASHA